VDHLDVDVLAVGYVGGYDDLLVVYQSIVVIVLGLSVGLTVVVDQSLFSFADESKFLP